MPLRARKRVGPFTLSPRAASFRFGSRRAGVSIGSRGARASVRVFPGVSFWKRLR